MSQLEKCDLCPRWAYLEDHHVFGAANRIHSERWGMVARLCPACHRTDKNSVHRDAERAKELKADYQRKFEEQHGHEKFMKIFGRNYL